MEKCLVCGMVLLLQTAKSKMCRLCFVKDRKAKANPRRCLDCTSVLKSRMKGRKRCKGCRLVYLERTRKGRDLPLCDCGKKISAKASSKCRECFDKSGPIPWNKGVKGLTPWNKGLSVFESKDAYRIHKNEQRKIQRKLEPMTAKIPDRIRTLIRNSLRHKANRRKQGTRTEHYIGCSIQNYMTHLEAQFLPGMTWDTYGNGEWNWNIDHIHPISRFDLTDEGQAKKAFHFSNCRPMWAIENFKKGNRLTALTTVVTY